MNRGNIYIFKKNLIVFSQLHYPFDMWTHMGVCLHNLYWTHLIRIRLNSLKKKKKTVFTDLFYANFSQSRFIWMPLKAHNDFIRNPKCQCWAVELNPQKCLILCHPVALPAGTTGLVSQFGFFIVMWLGLVSFDAVLSGLPAGHLLKQRRACLFSDHLLPAAFNILAFSSLLWSPSVSWCSGEGFPQVTLVTYGPGEMCL